jgi:hypothetical protein
MLVMVTSARNKHFKLADIVRNRLKGNTIADRKGESQASLFPSSTGK